MLIACHQCHRQYDVGVLEPGRKIRCFCGEVTDVPHQAPVDVRMLHCSSCGGALEEGATRCGYCACEVELGERGLGEVCPECFGRMVKDARFCSGCGVAIAPQSVLKALTSQKCPRCQGALALCEGGAMAFTECTGCGGLWLEEAAFQHFVDTRDAQAIRRSVEILPDRGPDAVAESRPVRYLACPVCGDMMNRRNFARRSGIIIDWCGGHGYWFDTHELERIIQYVESPAFRPADDRRDPYGVGAGSSEAERDAMKTIFRADSTPGTGLVFIDVVAGLIQSLFD